MLLFRAAISRVKAVFLHECLRFGSGNAKSLAIYDCKVWYIIEFFRGRPRGARQLYFTFPSAPDPFFKTSKAPCLALRVATPSGAPLQAPLELSALPSPRRVCCKLACRRVKRSPESRARSSKIRAGSRVYWKHARAFMRTLAKPGELRRTLANPQQCTHEYSTDIHQSSGEGPPHSPEFW